MMIEEVRNRLLEDGFHLQQHRAEGTISAVTVVCSKCGREVLLTGDDVADAKCECGRWFVVAAEKVGVMIFDKEEKKE